MALKFLKRFTDIHQKQLRNGILCRLLPIPAPRKRLGAVIIPMETKYGTGSDNPNIDGDGHKDGEEVLNGYNPNGEGNLILAN